MVTDDNKIAMYNDDEIYNCLGDIMSVLDKYQFQYVMELGILEWAKQEVYEKSKE